VNDISTEKLSSCLSCESKSLKFLDAPRIWIDPDHFAEIKEQLGLSKCADCGLVMTNPRPGGRILASFYDKPGYQCHELHSDAAQLSDAAARFEIFEPAATKGVLLDYGCGSGNMLRASRIRGWQPVGVEIGVNARSILLAEGFEVFPDLAGAEHLRGQIDVLTMIHVLEHLVEPGLVLRQVSEMLKPNGLFVVEVPNAGSLRARIAGSPLAGLLTRPVQRYQAFPIHLYHFEVRQLTQLLEKHGFEIVAMHTVGMGVEELLPLPPPSNGKASEKTSANNSASSTTSKAPKFAKRAIKTAMSRLRLGEQLFVICRNQKTGSARM